MDIFISIFLMSTSYMSTTFNGHTHLSFALGFLTLLMIKCLQYLGSLSWTKLIGGPIILIGCPILYQCSFYSGIFIILRLPYSDHTSNQCPFFGFLSDQTSLSSSSKVPHLWSIASTSIICIVLIIQALIIARSWPLF